MMNPEFPLIRDMTAEQKRTFLFTAMRPKNEHWVELIKEEIEYFEDHPLPSCITTYGAPLIINENLGNMAANLQIAVSRYEDYVMPNSDILLSEDIPPQLVFDHRDNKKMNHFLRMLMRRDVLSDLGFPTSGRDGAIENISWETRKYKIEESNIEALYLIAESPKDPKVFLIRTLWPPKEDERVFVFSENIWVGNNKKSVIAAHETKLEEYGED